MDIMELKKRAERNKAEAVAQKKKEIRDYVKDFMESLYNDSLHDLEEDRKTEPYAFPDDYTVFDLMADNVVEGLDWYDEAGEVPFIQKVRDFYKTGNSPIEEFAW